MVIFFSSSVRQDSLKIDIRSCVSSLNWTGEKKWRAVKGKRVRQKLPICTSTHKPPLLAVPVCCMVRALSCVSAELTEFWRLSHWCSRTGDGDCRAVINKVWLVINSGGKTLNNKSFVGAAAESQVKRSIVKSDTATLYSEAPLFVSALSIIYTRGRKASCSFARKREQYEP